MGDFDLHHSLGGGSSGQVFAGTDRETGDQVALKLMQSARVSSPFAALSFARELRALAEVAHPSIPRLLGSGLTDDGHLYVVMTRVRGNTLAAVLRRANELSDVDRAALLHEVLIPAFVDMCDAVEHAHDRGFVHRDLKPANIILDTAGRAWVVDWGLATDATTLETEVVLLETMRAQQGPRERARGPLLTGTPGYMSPERFGGDSDATDPRLDVFGLGVVLFEMLTGARAFGRGGRVSGILEAMRCPVQDPRSLDPSIPDALAEACMAAMGPDPSQRTPTVAALRAQVEAAHRGDRAPLRVAS